VHLAHRNNLLVASGALPILGVAIGESHLTSPRVDPFDSGLATPVEGSFNGGAIGQLDLVGFERDWKTFVID